MTPALLVFIASIAPTLTLAIGEASRELKTPAKIDSTNSIEQLVDDLHSTKEKFVISDENSRKLLGNLYDVNVKIKDMSKRRNRLTDEMLSAKVDTNSLAKSIVNLEDRIKNQRKLLSRRLRTLYKMGEHGTLETIFSSQTSFELDRNLAFLKRVADRDYEIIQDFESNIKSLQSQRSRLKRNIQHLVLAQHRLKSQESILESEQKSKSKLLVQLRQVRQDHLAHLAGLRKRANEISHINEIPSLLDESFFERKGTLPLPIQGVVLREYGINQNDRYRFKTSHKGIFLKGEQGLPVKAVFNGLVQFAGPIDGYGNTVIIDHGDRYYSVYSHQSSISVKIGQKISEEQVIGLSGLNTYQESGIYFEIRHFSDSIDPKPWMKWHNDIEKLRR
ncbi:MAG: peptidoglycan DD-metalloendopeptidase family protein [Bdellovibrionales bacterium]|nr:peptidoglycan DD-metalloendopeptidase family protein [Bdellovibrionales bacterium]